MLIWRGPAIYIVLVPMVAGAYLIGYLLLHQTFGMDEVVANGIGFILGCLGTIGIDIYHRKRNYLALFDIGASSIFLVFPAWLVGVFGIIWAVVTLIRNA